MELGAFLRMLRRWWLTLLIATWVAAVTGFLVASALPPRYEAETQVLVGPASGDIDTLRASSMLVQTYAQLAASDEVLGPALQSAGANMSPDSARDSLRATGDDVTRVVTIRFEDADPNRAAAVVKSVGEQLGNVAGADTSRPEGQITTLVEAQVPQQSVAPRTTLLVILAALIGLLGAAALAFVFDRLFPAIHGANDLPDLIDAPALGSIPGERIASDEVPVVVELPRASGAQTAYRLLASRLGLAALEGGRIHVAGVDARSGAGEVAANLAAVLASAGQRAALIDADPEGVASTLLAADSQAAIADTAMAIRDVPTRTSVRAIRVGPLNEVALPDEDIVNLVDDLVEDEVVTIIVGPPLGAVASAVQWATLAPSTLLVVRQDATRRDDVAVAAKSLQLVEAAPIGAAIVASKRSLPGIKRLDDLRKHAPQPTWTPPADPSREQPPAPSVRSGRRARQRRTEPADRLAETAE
ncbi:MAG TPA: Wzz/FepE/Etk N-terminal domain-containing protein [Candidatus Limnocylindrales bacterium]|nr:Wzz/FepE/Etk N-terminal domain-containing protein [Candidatus Limnocylindrales bacterium]